MRFVTDAADIPYFIPPMKNARSHHVISRGQSPNFYRLEDLHDSGTGHTPWVAAFERMFVGLFLALDAPVPYAFRTPDGRVRSLDAGCMKWLSNRSPAEIEFTLDAEGFIDTVVPSANLLARYEQDRLVLRDRIIKATPGDD
ncbi:hypothetical protein [Methylobrevis albus]|uniref:Uncharacterized protein n=1 Tax=Methylobrevis albus TaxID=2793297 RepID=A0A931N0D0_9HYPH|nr:hypothetical protein [Methylobrevis albus]MBH0239049.1 hypothetical protein [Methylobrevis albus]